MLFHFACSEVKKRIPRLYRKRFRWMIMNITYLVIMKTCHHPSMSGKKYEGAETAWTLLTRLNLECCWRLTENFHFTFWYFLEWISEQSSLSAEVVNATFSYFVGSRILYIWVLLFYILMCFILVPNTLYELQIVFLA